MCARKYRGGLAANCRAEIRSALAATLDQHSLLRETLIDVRTQEEAKQVQRFLIHSLGAQWLRAGSRVVKLSFLDKYVEVFDTTIRLSINHRLSIRRVHPDSLHWGNKRLGRVVQARLRESNFIDE